MPPPSEVKDIAPPAALNTIAGQGFASGVLRFGTISMITHLLLNYKPGHPVYRGLTIQFKVFIQISAMTLGGCIFAEKRVTEFNDSVRRRNRALDRSRRVWSEEAEIRAIADQRYKTYNKAPDGEEKPSE
ncbi:hypothetical protein B0A52_06492 [Exophiala mesophila]|uniref:HIG1 domain-containing protein n=1 Tax=Exophiala mesophila TaxID=212818 RepID=A0A0D1XSE7_EXOME|nr:uncharacterized protein PV10_05608 [Exophiala mesophila]KIV91016.1 hypothetical protein PV10_05608 [Exophiala mesophila]RVX69429.1 hypothetical protein B0A52_06492 [Exophiala mesophila]